MKKISGDCTSTKQISLSKAAKVLSKFVSAENGASQVINAYLHRASISFNELNQLHKELKLSCSHQKHKRHRTENADQDGEKSTQTVVKFSQAVNDSIGYHAGNADESEKHKKNKKKQQEFESMAQNEIESGLVQGDEGEGNTGLEERKKQKSEKKEKKDKEGAFNFSSSKGGSGHHQGIEKKLSNNGEVENGWLGGSHDPQIKKKKKYEDGSDNKFYAEEVNMVQKKRKNEHVDGSVEDRYRDLSKKRIKRKHEGDH